MTVIRVGDVVLEGLYHQGRGGEAVVVAPPLPGLGGTMDHAVLAEVCWALTRAGHSTLRFNWRGVGASTGRLTMPPVAATGEAEVTEAALDEAYADLAAAIEQHIETCGAPRCAVVGYSFGAQVAARGGVEHPAVERVVLIAPPVTRLPFDLGALAATGAPTSIVCGELDEVAPLAAVEAAVASSPGAAFSVRKVAGAGHPFARGLSQLGQIVAQCFPSGAERDDLEP